MTLYPSPAHTLAHPLLLLAVVVTLLSACNPLTTPLPGDGSSLYLRYTGPEDGVWYELSLSGAGGYEVTVTMTVVGPDAHERLCRDAATGQVETCLGYPGLANLVDPFIGSATYRAVFTPFSDDLLIHDLTCRQGGAARTCPASLRVSARVVDAQGNTAGDLLVQA